MMNVINKLAVVIVIAIFVQIGCQSVSGAEAGTSGMAKVAESDSLILLANRKDGRIAVKDKNSNQIWYGNPTDAANDPLAKGTAKMEIQSQLTVTYTDAATGGIKFANSQVSCVNKEGLHATLIDKGIRFEYKFVREQMTIPVEYTLERDHFQASIDSAHIEDNPKTPILSIALLPYFGAGSMTDTGYMMVPDGSGALIHLNNGKEIYNGYNKPIYGFDPALEKPESRITDETIRMPVFGIKKGDAAMLGVVKEGDAIGSIMASVSKARTSYNNIYINFQYRMLDQKTLLERDYTNQRTVTRLSQEPTKLDRLTIRYYFLSGNKADYSGMASRYRQYLVQEKGLVPRPEKPAFYLDLYGAIQKQKSFLGIPFNAVTPLTTFKQAEKITDELARNGVQGIVLRYQGWLTGGMIKGNVPTRASAEPKLGGNKGLQTLNDHLRQQNGVIYPDVDLLQFGKTGFGIYAMLHSAKSVFHSPALQNDYKLSTYERDKQVEPWFLLAYHKIAEESTRFLQSYAKLGIPRISAGTLGNLIYSDFSKGGSDRGAGIRIWEGTLDRVRSRVGGLVLDEANAYALPYADHITAAPIYTSNYDVIDESIPFYEIVLHGIVPLATPAINQESRPDYALLKAAETGMNLHYSGIAEHSTLLKDTPYIELYGTEYSGWKQQAIAKYKKLKPLLERIYDKPIIRHEQVKDQVYVTTFEGGIQVIVNYSASPVVSGTRTIDAYGFSWIGG